MSTIAGKALLAITRIHEDGERPLYEVGVHLQSAEGGEYAHESAREDFWLLEYAVLPLPRAARKLQPGETVRVYVVYLFRYWTDYWGECDVTLDYRKERVLRRQKARPFYVCKKDRA